MIRTLLTTTALLLAVPAIAQTTATPEPDSSVSAPAEQAAPAEAAPAQQSAEPAQSSEQAQAATGATSVAAIVDSEFPAYDADKSGQLDQSEFGKWMVALKDQEMKATGKTLAPAEVSAWASGAFTTADKDKNAEVSKTELVNFLSGSAG